MKYLKFILYFLFCIIFTPLALFIIYVDQVFEIAEKIVDKIGTQVRDALWAEKGGEA